jgi:serine/threonine protein phosphatase PrpC
MAGHFMLELRAEDLVSEPRPIPVERLLLRAVGRTDVGAQRTQNEDAMYSDDFLGVYVVCDGMGGHASGQVASDIAIRTIVHSLKTGDPPPPPGQDPLTSAMKAANTAVYQRSLMDPACHGMGTTAVGLRFEENIVHVCHCGDSRAYLLRGGMLSQITRDHSLRNLYQDRPDLVGTLGPATSNVIIRAVGLDASVEIEHNQGFPEHGDVYLLCCDGLSDLVDDWMIREIMTSGDSLETVAENLIRAANNNGGTDNITVVLVQTFFDPLWIPAMAYQQAQY